MNTINVKVTFIRIKNNAGKLDFICSKALESIEQEKRLLILVGSQEAGLYIDALLWKKPEEGFIPHLFTAQTNAEWIAITMEQRNINQAAWILNLHPQVVSFAHECEEIYEIFDETSPDKAAQSQQRLNAYRSMGAFVSPMK